MILQLDRIKEPSGVNDLKNIKINGEPHFVSSLGGTVRIYHEMTEVHSFRMPFCVFHIFPYQDCYFLIGRKRYVVYRGFTKVSEHVFEQEFNKVDKILAIKNFVIVFYENKHYMLGRIRNMQMELGDTLDDGQFFTVLGSEEFDNRIVILAKTFTRVYLLVYTVENNKHTVTKKEIQCGLAIARHCSNTILVFDKQGMWRYDEKLTFVKEFANYKITATFFDAENNRTLLFCKNGEVIAVNFDLSHSILGTFSSPIVSLAKIGSLFFCGSAAGSYFVHITDRVTVLKSVNGVSDCTCKSPDTLKSLLLHKMHCETDSPALPAEPRDGGHPIKKARPAVVVDVSPINKAIAEIHTHKRGPSRFTGYLKNSRFTILNFQEYSIVNNSVLEHVLGASESVIFTPKRVLRFGEGPITQFDLTISHIKIYEAAALLYGLKEVVVLDMHTFEFKSTPVDFDFCDFELRVDEVICLDFAEAVHAIPTAKFKKKTVKSVQQSPESLFTETCSPLLEFNLPATTLSHISAAGSDAQTPMFAVNGRILTLVDGVPFLLFDAGSHISNHTCLNNQVVISCENTAILNNTTSKVAYCNFESTGCFMVEEDVFVCLPSGEVRPLSPPVFRENLSNEKFLLRNGARVETTVDQKTVKFSLKAQTLEFENCILKFCCAIRNHLFCVGLIYKNSIRGKLVFILANKKRVRVRQTIELDSIPLCACASDNRLCVVTSEDILLLTLRHGKIKIKKKIRNAHCPCKDVQFYDASTVLITTFDWFYLVVNLEMNMVEKIQTDWFSIPFMINSVNGFAIKNVLHYQGAAIDCIEDVVYLLSHENSVLALTENGSVLCVQISQSEVFRFIYDSVPKVVSNLSK